MIKEPGFSVGMEEEYLLVDLVTRNVVTHSSPGFFRDCERLLQDYVAPEFLQCQIEVNTPVCATIKEAHKEIASLRGAVAGVAREHGLGLIAASTHPFAGREDINPTRKRRYKTLETDLQEVVRRLMIGGMHVHVGIEDDDLRIDLMGQAAYTLPHILALSTSSPFWQGLDTGLKSYRISVWNGMPRTGLPFNFTSYTEYQRHVDVLVEAGIIEDATMVWWDLRPSHRYPTLEMRIADVCTRIEDGVCIAAMYLCWLRMLYRLRRRNQRWREYAGFLINENRWRAHRYGIDEGLLDFGRGCIVPYAELFEEFVALVREDAEALDCVEELEHGRRIIKRGTSAHRQVRTYREAVDDGASHEQALVKVVDMLMEESLRGATEKAVPGAFGTSGDGAAK